MASSSGVRCHPISPRSRGLQRVRPRLSPHRQQTLAEAADQPRRTAQALSLGRPRPVRTLGTLSGQRGGDGEDGPGLPAGSRGGLSVSSHACARRERQLLSPRLRPGWCGTRCEVPPYQALHAPDQRRVERFHGRGSSEVLGLTLCSQRDLEPLRRGFNAADNARRPRVLDGQTPNPVVAERLPARHPLATTKTQGRAGPDDIVQARLLLEAAKEVSQPDKGGGLPTVCQYFRMVFCNGGSAPATLGFFAFGQTGTGAGAAVSAPASPPSRQRSGRIPALPYPLRERFRV
jgi:hypothetical protein